MQEIQSCGQPPEEIIQELAPDLQLGPDGAPSASAGALGMFSDLAKDQGNGGGAPGCPIQ